MSLFDKILGLAEYIMHGFQTFYWCFYQLKKMGESF